MEAPEAGKRGRCRYCDAIVEGPALAGADPFDGLFADRDGNGIPDGIEAMLRNPGAVGVHHQSSTSYTVNGIRYAKLEDAPMEVRALLEKTQGLLDGMPETSLPAAPAEDRGTKVQAIPKALRVWILLAIGLAFLAGIAVVLLVF